MNGQVGDWMEKGKGNAASSMSGLHLSQTEILLGVESENRVKPQQVWEFLLGRSWS